MDETGLYGPLAANMGPFSHQNQTKRPTPAKPKETGSNTRVLKLEKNENNSKWSKLYLKKLKKNNKFNKSFLMGSKYISFQNGVNYT